MCYSWFIVLLLAVGYEGLVVKGPDGAVSASVGDEVILNCSVDSRVSVEEIEEVSWKRTDTDVLVLLYQGNEVLTESSDESYQGRVEFFITEIPKGNFSLKLKDVKTEDKGEYMCEVHTRSQSANITVILQRLGLVVKGPDGALSAWVGEEVILNCSVDSDGSVEEVSWKRTDKDVLVLLYQGNEVLSDSSDESYQGRVEFFITEIPKGNFSLKLKDVNLEDKGEYMCEVHMREQSGHTIVILQRFGFSMFHVMMIMMCLFALLTAVGLCIPITILYRKKVTNGSVMKMHAALIFIPNMCLCTAFILWSTEGFLVEIVTCSVVSIIRPLLLLKTFPYLHRFPKHITQAVKTLSVPVYQFIISLAASSMFSGNIHEVRTRNFISLAIQGGISFIYATVLATFSFHTHSAVVLQICNGFFLGVLLNFEVREYSDGFLVTSVLSPLAMGTMMILFLQKHFFHRKSFRRAHIVNPSVTVTLLSLGELGVYGIVCFETKNFTVAWMLPFEAVLFIVVWISVIGLLYYGRGCCSTLRGLGYLCCFLIAALLNITFGALSIYYINLRMTLNKGGYVALIILANVLTVISFFKHPKQLPGLPVMLIYMFGTVGLTVISSVTLVAELSMKAGKGARAIEDLRVIVLSFETLFLFGWISLQIYGVWVRVRHRIKQNFEDQKETEHEDCQEMEVVSKLKPSDSSEEDNLS